MAATDTPLIYTIKGNLPESSLVRTTTWEETPDYVKLITTRKLGDEIVRQDVDVLSRHSLPMGVEQASIA